MGQDFKLDTSGSVNLFGVSNADCLPKARFGSSLQFEWEDLSPFAQGYVEALFASTTFDVFDDAADALYGFSDLHPEALAMILRDCEHPGLGVMYKATAEGGREFWSGRQNRLIGRVLPPLRVYLDDAGKVRLEEAGKITTAPTSRAGPEPHQSTRPGEDVTRDGETWFHPYDGGAPFKV